MTRTLDAGTTRPALPGEERTREALEWAIAEIEGRTRYDSDNQFDNAMAAAKVALSRINPVSGAIIARAPVDDEELRQWADLRADDAGRLARELVGYRQITDTFVREVDAPVQEVGGALVSHRAPTPASGETRKALIEAAVQAALDAGLAVNGHHGVAAARHAARFVLAALASEDVQGWRDISTAPKDENEFQAWVVEDGRGWWEPRCRFNDDAFQVWGRVDYDQDGWDIYPRITPTHWMPDPPAPITAPPAPETRT